MAAWESLLSPATAGCFYSLERDLMNCVTFWSFISFMNFLGLTSPSSSPEKMFNYKEIATNNTESREGGSSGWSWALGRTLSITSQMSTRVDHHQWCDLRQTQKNLGGLASGAPHQLGMREQRSLERGIGEGNGSSWVELSAKGWHACWRLSMTWWPKDSSCFEVVGGKPGWSSRGDGKERSLNWGSLCNM